MPDTPLDRIAAVIRSGAGNTPVYIGRLPKQAESCINVARGQSQGLLHGYGGVAYLYTTANITCRDKLLADVETLLINVIFALSRAPNCWIAAISPVQTKNEGDIEVAEISITVESLERIS